MKQVNERSISSVHLKNFFLGWQNPIAAELIIFLVLTFGISFVVMGGVLFSINSSLFYYEFDYTDACRMVNTCIVGPVTFPSNIKGPLFVQYRVENFRQSHYRYIKSYPINQLLFGKIDDISNSNCSPYLTNKDLGVTISANGIPLNPTSVAVPCGMAAYTFFNDTFRIQNKITGEFLTISNKNISWKDDRTYKFINTDLNIQWIDFQYEPFINWMRISPYNSLFKTWGRIDAEGFRGVYQIVITNNWKMEKFGVRKWVVLSTVGFYGTKNTFLAVFFLVFGSIAVIFGSFLVGYEIKKKSF